MMKKLIALLLCLLLCTGACAESVKLDIKLWNDDQTAEIGTAAGVLADGSLLMDLNYALAGDNVNDANGLSVYLDKDKGLMVRKNDDWRRVTFMGNPLGGSEANSLSVENLQQQLMVLLNDLSTMAGKMNNATETYGNSAAAQNLIGKLSDLGHMTLTGADINSLMDAYVKAYMVDLLGMEYTVSGNSATLAPGAGLPSLIEGTQLQDMWSMLWMLIAGNMSEVPVTRYPDFTLTTACESDRGMINLVADGVLITLNYQKASGYNSYTYTMAGTVNGTNISANGTVNGSQVTLNMQVGDNTVTGILTMGRISSLTLTVTDQYGSQVFSLMGTMTGNGFNATVTTEYDVLALNCVANSNGFSFSYTNSSTWGGIRNSLDFSLMSNKLNFTYYDGYYTTSCAVVKGADNSFDVTYSKVNPYGRGDSFSGRLAMTNTGMTVTGSMAYSYSDTPTTFALNLYFVGNKAGYEWETASASSSSSFAQTLELIDNTWHYVQRWTDTSRWASYSNEIVADLTQLNNGYSVTLTVNDGYNDSVTTNTLVGTLTTDDQVIALNVTMNGEPYVTGTLTMTGDRQADLVVTHHNSGNLEIAGVLSLDDQDVWHLVGTITQYNTPVNMDIALDPAAELTAPQVPATVANLELTELVNWLVN